jgi:pilus assembly protein Flp/PilA
MVVGRIAAEPDDFPHGARPLQPSGESCSPTLSRLSTYPVVEKELEMSSAMSRVRRFLVSEDGPTAVEYAVMLALIVVVCVGIIKSLGTTISGTFSSVQSSLGS